MIIISIDLGEKSGVAKFDTELGSITCDTLDLEQVLSYHLFTRPDIIILEDMPSETIWKTYLALVFHLLLLDKTTKVQRDNVILVKPGTWKPIAKANKWRYKYAKSDHEQDACNLIRYCQFAGIV